MRVVHQKISVSGRTLHAHVVAEDDPHPKSYAAAVLLREQLFNLDPSLHWKEKVGLSRRLVRQAIAAEPELSCMYCGNRVYRRQAQGKKKRQWASLEHIVPVSRGGHPSDRANLGISCEPCNNEKADMMPEEWALHRRETGRTIGLEMAERARAFLEGPKRAGWIQTLDGHAHAFVRRSVRLFGRGLEPCFDLANLQVRDTMRGRGALTAFVSALGGILPEGHPVLLESVLNPRLAAWAIREGWTPYGKSYAWDQEPGTDSFYFRVGSGRLAS